jgi:hypothetical protein
VLGLLIIFAWYFSYCFRMGLDWWFDNSPPDTQPPQTNAPNPVITIPAGTRMVWDIAASSPGVGRVPIAYRDVRTNHWVDRYGPPGAIWTNVIQTTIQAREKLTAPWTNYYTFTIWSSSSKGRELLVRNGAGQPIWTNYIIINSQNPYGQFSPPIGMFGPSPAKFFRAAIVHQ